MLITIESLLDFAYHSQYFTVSSLNPYSSTGSSALFVISILQMRKGEEKKTFSCSPKDIEITSGRARV